MNRKYKIAAACMALILLFSSFFFFYQKQQNERQEPVSVTGFKLNTMIKITVYDEVKPELLDKAMALCDKYEELFSRTLSDSEIYKLNHGTLPKKNRFLSRLLQVWGKPCLPFFLLCGQWEKEKGRRSFI